MNNLIDLSRSLRKGVDKACNEIDRLRDINDDLLGALEELVEQFHAYENGWIDGKPGNFRYRIGLPDALYRAEEVIKKSKGGR